MEEKNNVESKIKTTIRIVKKNVIDISNIYPIRDDLLKFNHPKIQTNDKLKLHLTKKQSNISEKISFVEKPCCIKHITYQPPNELKLETRDIQNSNYLVDLEGGYIFRPDDIKECKYEPIGKFEHDHDPEKRYIEWYYKYELDHTI